MGGTCRLMKELIEIEGVKNLPYESIERIKSIICGTHNGVCSERFSGIKVNTGLFKTESKSESLSGLFTNGKTKMEGEE